MRNGISVSLTSDLQVLSTVDVQNSVLVLPLDLIVEEAQLLFSFKTSKIGIINIASERAFIIASYHKTA